MGEQYCVYTNWWQRAPGPQAEVYSDAEFLKGRVWCFEFIAALSCTCKQMPSMQNRINGCILNFNLVESGYDSSNFSDYNC